VSVQSAHVRKHSSVVPFFQPAAYCIQSVVQSPGHSMVGPAT